LLSQYYTAESEGNPAPHEEMFLFLALVLKMDHVLHDILKQPWLRKPMCPHVMWCSRFFDILTFQHYENEMLPRGVENIMIDLGK
jgi:hypothetical protein